MSLGNQLINFGVQCKKNLWPRSLKYIVIAVLFFFLGLNLYIFNRLFFLVHTLIYYYMYKKEMGHKFSILRFLISNLVLLLLIIPTLIYLMMAFSENKVSLVTGIIIIVILTIFSVMVVFVSYLISLTEVSYKDFWSMLYYLFLKMKKNNLLIIIVAVINIILYYIFGNLMFIGILGENIFLLYLYYIIFCIYITPLGLTITDKLNEVHKEYLINKNK